jgi:hypothetical protein
MLETSENVRDSMPYYYIFKFYNIQNSSFEQLCETSLTDTCNAETPLMLGEPPGKSAAHRPTTMSHPPRIKLNNGFLSKTIEHETIEQIPAFSSAWPGLQTCINESTPGGSKVNKPNPPRKPSEIPEIKKKVKRNPNIKGTETDCEYCDKKFSVNSHSDTI